ncbi:hypothetical protein [Kaarinaea lacus]
MEIILQIIHLLPQECGDDFSAMDTILKAGHQLGLKPEHLDDKKLVDRLIALKQVP